MNSQTNNAEAAANVVVFSINPNSGASDNGKLCASIAARLESKGFQAILSTDLDEVEAETKKHLQSGSLRAVVAAGGDGTIALLANRLPRETPFAILPLGTENLLGLHLGLKAEEDFFVSLVEHGSQTRIDAGRANGKLFLVVASCGFDAAVVKRLDEVRSGHISRASWLKPIWQTILSYRFPILKYSLDDEPPIEARWAFIFNIPRYAIGLRITPEAIDSDGKLDICTFQGRGVFRGLWYLLVTYMGGHSRLDASRLAQFRKLKIESDSDRPVYYELDGDPGGELPLEIEVVPQALRILLPQSDGLKKTRARNASE